MYLSTQFIRYITMPKMKQFYCIMCRNFIIFQDSASKFPSTSKSLNVPTSSSSISSMLFFNCSSLTKSSFRTLRHSANSTLALSILGLISAISLTSELSGHKFFLVYLSTHKFKIITITFHLHLFIIC